MSAVPPGDRPLEIPRSSRLLTRRRFIASTIGGSLLLLAGCSRDKTPPKATATSVPLPTPTPVASVPGYDDPTRWTGRTLTVTSWGGVYQDAQQRAFIEPFERLTGASIDTGATDLITLRNQVDNEEVEWDVCDVLSEDVLSLANVGILEPIDYDTINQLGIFADATMEFGVGSSYFSTLLAFQANAWPGTPDPANWIDFWDLERYPGYRGLYRDPRTTLEFALLADGVSMNSLYPLDVDRAFDSLDRIRPSLTLFWEQGAQAAQSLTTGGISMDSAWHNRILEIQGEGAEVKMVWEGGALAGDSWVVPRGAPNRDVAMDFINFATRAETCAAFATFAPFGPVNKGAFDLLPPDISANLPSSPELKTKQFVLDYEWWFTHLDTVSPRFEDWLAEHP